MRVVADVAGALIHIHDNPGLPRLHRRHGRMTPRHLLIGVDGTASLFTAREPFSKLLPPQPDLGYLAPELLTQSGPATPQSDVFSLGVLLWEALDNGRLFPHRRAAAISRLIARRSLPGPRIEEEWALPLGEVAMRALSQDPAERHADATAFWLALREHLPAPDAARAVLSRLAQRALQLELTTDIRDRPPFVGARTRGAAPETQPSSEEAPARYSLRPEASSRRAGPSLPVPRAEDPAWALSDVPPRSSELDLEPVAAPPEPGSEPPQAWRAPRSEAAPAARRSAPPSAPRSSSLPRASSPPSASSPPRPSSPPVPRASEPPAVYPETEAASVSTLHVNLPRELIDASLPFYAAPASAPRSFPWGALSFAALIFFGVGAAVAFGAVTALRGPAGLERVPLAAPAAAPAAPTATAPAAAQPVAPAPAAPADAPAPPAPSPSAASAASGTPSPTGSTDAVEPTPAAPAPAPPSAAGSDATSSPERATPAPRKAVKRSRPSKARRPRAEAAAPRPGTSPGNSQETVTGSASTDLLAEPWSEPEPPAPRAAPAPATELPFVDQPY